LNPEDRMIKAFRRAIVFDRLAGGLRALEDRGGGR
jgi:hypothetical protein